jgi:leucyl/phenylalanyl-tRNA--protein transferase
MPIFRLAQDPFFPDPELAEPNGLLAIGGDLSPARLLAAYREGIFPWFSENDPILWWFTSPRLVISPEHFKPSSRLLRYFRKPLFKITMDTAFEEVITTCRTIRTDKNEDTWITDEMMEAYMTLHKLGFCHSVECWDGSKLAGGLYGVAIDKIFFGESMFSLQSNASKIALVALIRYVKKRNFALIDCQMTTEHLLRMGAEEISGKQFTSLLRQNIKSIQPNGKWNYEPDQNV